MPATLSPATAAYAPARLHRYATARAWEGSSSDHHRATGATWASSELHTESQLGTRERLLLTRFEKLLPTVWAEWESKLPYLNGVDTEDALARMGTLLLAVPLAATDIVAGFTFEQSLYVRAELPIELGGTLYAEVNLGSEADIAEDTFVAVRQHRQEQWSASGSFLQVLAMLQQYVAR